MKTYVVSRDKDEEMESREMVKALNLPNGCVVTTTNRYSTSISNSSVFIPGYNFVGEMDEFRKLETWEDVALEEGQKAYEMDNLNENEFTRRGQKQSILIKQMEALSILQTTRLSYEDMIFK